MMKRTVLAAAAMAAVLAAGCGGADDTSNAAAQPTVEASAPTTAAPTATEASTTAAPTTTAAATTTAAPANTSKISLDEFNQLQSGMTYEQAVAVIGGEGKMLSESTFGDTTTRMYQWDGSNDSGFGANANAVFQNDALVTKAQFGLK